MLGLKLNHDSYAHGVQKDYQRPTSTVNLQMASMVDFADYYPQGQPLCQ